MTGNTDPIAAARAMIEPLTGYTSGPWRVSPTDDTTVICPERTVVAEIDGDYNEPDLWPVMEDNARLIAAAPDLRDMVATLADALEAERVKVAAAYEAAACVTVGMGPRYDGRSVHYHIPERVKGAIRALTPPDAQAALDKMLAAARAEAAEAALTAAAGGA